MEIKIEEIIQNVVEASNRHDDLALSQMVAEDVFFTEPFAEEPIKGRKAYKEDIAGLFSYIPDVKFELLSLIGKDKQAAFELK